MTKKSFRSFLTLCLTLLLSAHALGKSSYPFAIRSEKIGDHYQIIAYNRGYGPVSVLLSLSARDNIQTDQSFPLAAVVRANSHLTLATLRAANPARSFRFSTQSHFLPGNFHALHEPNTLYRLPFADGLSFVISQAPGGPQLTHNTPESAQAIDFTMPEGTPIVAARSGIVIAAEGHNQFGSKNPAMLTLANHVRILHSDDSIATYGHLAPGGVDVAVGQRVTAGRVIGRSGSTGYSSGPHLHFVVHQLQRGHNGFGSISVPIRFHVGNPAYAFTPQYLQKVTADYHAPGRAPPFVEMKKTGQKTR